MVPHFLKNNFLVKLKGPMVYTIFKCNSHKWTSNIVRNSFISFFKENNHKYIPSSPVIPWNDNSLEFVNAGMNQFKSSLLGLRKYPANCAVNSQKCIRVGGKHNDLSDVGKDTYHHTFFEMLGNWSFNNYFKEEACRMSWNLLTKVFKIPPEHLYITYFGGDKLLGLEEDEEVKNIWLSLGVHKDRIIPFGMKENFWEMGDLGPCGPCTEIHFQREPSSNGASKVNSGSEDLIEIWNLVFIQYQRVDGGQLIPLHSKFVDTGMGLERITACLNGKKSNYDTDLFIPLFNEIEKISGMPCYRGEFNSTTDSLDTYYRILADHSRMVSVSLADGLLPHDNYSLRKAIRRCMLIGWEKFNLGATKNFMENLLRVVTDGLGDTYPELAYSFKRSKSLLDFEEQQLRESQLQLSKDWPKLVESYPVLSTLTNVTPKVIEALQYLLPNYNNLKAKQYTAEEALNLMERYTLSPEIVTDIVEALGLNMDMNNFICTLEANRNKLSENSLLKMELYNITETLKENKIPTTDNHFKYSYSYSPEKGYQYASHQSDILRIFSKGSLVHEINKENEAVIVTKSSNFYPKSGGQTSDSGFIELDENKFKVSKVVHISNYVLHYGTMVNGSLRTGDVVNLNVSKGHRLGASKLHTAHHLLRGAIEAVAGMAFQRASQVLDKYLIMDVFVHPPLEVEQLMHAENIVKEWIRQNKVIKRDTIPLFDALRIRNVTLVSGEKYPEDVHLLSSECELPSEFHIQNSLYDTPKTTVKSCELCCGTHIFNTGHLESFAITDIKLQGKGVIRIKAVYGKEALKLNRNGEALLKEFDTWNKKITSALENNERMINLYNEFKKWKSQIKKSQIPATVFNFIEEKGADLLEIMKDIVLTKSNWEELHSEFRTHLSENPVGSIFYDMNTDYRGSLESLETIMKDVSRRPAVFVCKGWGRVRACIYIPENLQHGKSELKNVMNELHSTMGRGHIKFGSTCNEIALYHVNGVKREQIQEFKYEIINFCRKVLGNL